MNKETKLSLIIPCYNSAKYLPETFDCIRNQTAGLDGIEILFVDDASTDDGATLGLLQEFQKEIPSSRIIRHDVNKRQGGSRNTGVQNAQGQYVAFMDADDLISLDYLEKLLPAAFESDADILQFGVCEFIAAENGERWMQAQYLWPSEVIEHDDIEKKKDFVVNDKMTLGHWNKLYRRELLLRSGVKFKENGFYEEPPFTFPLRFYVNRFVTVEGCYYYCRQYADSSLHSRMSEASTLKDHLDSCLQLYDFMRQTEFYPEYKEEIDLRFFHSYVFETMYFCGQRGFGMDLPLYEEIRKSLFARVGRPFVNRYAPEGSLYYTLSEVIKRDTMTQELLNDVIDAVKDYQTQ